MKRSSLLKNIEHGVRLRCIEAPAGKVCDTSNLGTFGQAPVLVTACSPVGGGTR
jgi:hypothetical protein